MPAIPVCWIALFLRNDDVKVKLLSISDKHYDVLVGDCSGVDTAIQRFFLMHQYSKITVFASNGKARNNLGNWPINNVFVEEGIKGFDFYRQKDIAMAKEADFGFIGFLYCFSDFIFITLCSLIISYLKTNVGNSLLVHGLGLGAFTVMVGIQSLVGQLRSYKRCSTGEKNITVDYLTFSSFLG